MLRVLGLVLGLAALATPAATAAGRADVAALQAALRVHGGYAGDVDGFPGPLTRGALRAFQRRAGLVPDGIAGPRTRRALGALGRHRYGSRALAVGDVGWDVAVLQFRLETHGFPCRAVDGSFGAHTAAAVVRAQARAGLGEDGIAGPATRRALSGPPPRAPFALRRPVAAPIGDRFGPRGAGFHAGVDLPAPAGTPVRAAASGIASVAWDPGGFGRYVAIAHALGVRTIYAHLSAALVAPGAPVGAGALIGRVGTTGHSTGPHLHFEVRVRGAAVDPAPVLA